MTTISHQGFTVRIEELSGGRRKIKVAPDREGIFILYDECETSYPLELIRLMIEVNGPNGLCHEIKREEDESYVQKLLRNDLFAYFDPKDFAGKRILDFGCGSGASTMIMARMFPTSYVTGVEMYESSLSVAKKRAEFLGLPNVQFKQSSSETELPEGLGRFDFVILSAVYEHLLPNARKALLPQLWAVVADGGFLFINQTPNRFFPFELHTTMLPMINYLPDRVVHRLAWRLTNRVTRDQSWEHLLQQGIRGATEKEILRLLRRHDDSVLMLEPSKNGVSDRIDLYYMNTNQTRHRTLKRIAKTWIKTIRVVSGLTLVPDLSLAFEKVRHPH